MYTSTIIKFEYSFLYQDQTVINNHSYIRNILQLYYQERNYKIVPYKYLVTYSRKR